MVTGHAHTWSSKVAVAQVTSSHLKWTVSSRFVAASRLYVWIYFKKFTFLLWIFCKEKKKKKRKEGLFLMLQTNSHSNQSLKGPSVKSLIKTLTRNGVGHRHERRMEGGRDPPYSMISHNSCQAKGSHYLSESSVGCAEPESEQCGKTWKPKNKQLVLIIAF